MPFADAPKAPEAKTSSGISMSLMFTGKTKRVRFTINAQAQADHFGGKLESTNAKIMIGGGEDLGLAQIIITEDAPDQFRQGIKGSVSFVVGHWASLPNDKRPSAMCEVVSVSDDGKTVVIKLPSWANPHGSGGKLDATVARPVNTGKVGA